MNINILFFLYKEKRQYYAIIPINMTHQNTISLDSDLNLSLGEVIGLSKMFWSGDFGNPNHKLTPGQNRVMEDTKKAVQKNMDAMGLW